MSWSAARRRRHPVPAPARPAEEPGPALAAPSRRCPTCSPACSSARPARRRASTRRGTTASTNWKSRSTQMPAPGRRSAPALARRPAVPQPAGRRHRQHAPHRNLHRQAVLARRPDRAARPGRVSRLRDAAQRAHEPGAAAADPRARSRASGSTPLDGKLSAGARRCTTASCCRTSSGPTSSTCSTISGSTASTSARNGSRRSPSSASPSAARSSTRASGWNSGRRSSPGTCMGETGRHRRHRALRRLLGRTAAGQADRPDPARYIVTCNRRPRAAAADRHQRRAVAGVRFKAWQPAMACTRFCRSTRR